MKENNTFVRSLRNLREIRKSCKPSRMVMIAERTSELKSLEEKRKVKEKEIKELWNAIQTQDDENVKLLLDAKERIVREKYMNEELSTLREALTNPGKNHKEDDDLYISHSTDDWKSRLETDIERLQKGSNWPLCLSPRRVYLEQSREKVMLKSLHQKGYLERNGKKLPFIIGGRKGGKLHKKTRKAICSQIIMKGFHDKRKRIPEQSAKSKLMQRQKGCHNNRHNNHSKY